jgi:hypothetical protein
VRKDGASSKADGKVEGAALPRRPRPASSPCWQFPVSAPSSAPDGSRLC